MATIKRAYKYRFYPTDEQAKMLARTFGCCRVVYNWALAKKSDAYKQDQARLYYKQLSEGLTLLKKEEAYSWLSEVASVSLQQALRHLDKAFTNFFEKRGKYPTFKKKHARQSATYVGTAFAWRDGQITLAKMKEPLPIVWSRPLPDGAAPSSVTISRDASGRYFISILVEEEIASLPKADAAIGVDLGLKSFMALSSGELVGNPRFFKQDEKRLAKAQRRHAKKKKGSANRNKARRQVARIHARIADRRRDFLHQLSTRLIRENQTICVESLAVKNMVKNRKLSKAISDVGWSEFVSQLSYKADWYGRTLIKIDRFFPSSKRCSDCGHVVDSLTLDVRVWTCPNCGVSHERDINAAKCVLTEGLSVAACGGEVRPARASARSGSPQRSRKPSE